MKRHHAVALLLCCSPAESFLLPQRSCRTTLRLYNDNNFFQDLIAKAFENDDTVSQQDDKITGQIDQGEQDDGTRPAVLTATQQKWRQAQVLLKASDFSGTSFNLDLYLTGIPNKDPSNDLFGSRTNISSRDRQVGMAVPTQPTLDNIQVQFLDDSKCQILDKSDCGFVLVDQLGDWVLSDDGTQVRFRFQVSGYTRRIETKGTIQKVYWSKEDEKTTQTSTTYSIPPGWLYGETTVSKNSNNVLQLDPGILKIEQSMGILGAAVKMIPCGKFTAQRVTESD